MNYSYSYGDGIIIAKDPATGVIVTESCVKLRKIFAETGAVPPPFDTKKAMDILGVWTGDRQSILF